MSKQRALTDFLSRPSKRPRSSGKPKFVDLFCGFGGASTGAVEAGYDVVLAVDNWDLAIEAHRMNHPSTTHVCCELPPSEPLQLPSADEEWHLHGSPPCTKLSNANQQRDADDRSDGLELVRWYLDFAISSSATSWTMEQVSTPIVRNLLETYSRGLRLAWWVEDFYDHGVPQHRKRLLAGDAKTMARLARAPIVHKCVRDFVPEPRGDWIRGYVRNGGSRRPDPDNPGASVYDYYTDEDALVSVDGPSHTVTCSPLRWAFRDSNGTMQLEVIERETCKLLQCFPASYRLPEAPKASQQRLIGNALPPAIMKILLT